MPRLGPYDTDGLSTRLRTERAGVLVQAVERGVQAAGLCRSQRPGVDGVAPAAEALALERFAVFQQTFDGGNGQQRAGYFHPVGQLRLLHRAQGKEL